MRAAKFTTAAYSLPQSVDRPPIIGPFNEDDKCLPRRTPTPKASLLKQEDWEKSLN